MNLFVRGLAPDTQILIAIGSAVAAGCQPCLKQLVDIAKSEALEDEKLRAAVTIGQFIKDKPAKDMKALADELLGGDPASSADEMVCNCEAAASTNEGCCG